MSFSLLGLLPWLVVSVVLAALNITAAVILLKDRHLGAWLMLAGCAVSLLGQIGHFVMQFTVMTGKFDSGQFHLFAVMSSVTYLGALVFSAGLLLHALYQQSKGKRVAELEAIIASIQNR